MPTSAPHRDFCDPPPDCADWLADQQGFAGGSGSQTMRGAAAIGARGFQNGPREKTTSAARGAEDAPDEKRADSGLVDDRNPVDTACCRQRGRGDHEAVAHPRSAHDDRCGGGKRRIRAVGAVAAGLRGTRKRDLRAVAVTPGFGVVPLADHADRQAAAAGVGLGEDSIPQQPRGREQKCSEPESAGVVVWEHSVATRGVPAPYPSPKPRTSQRSAGPGGVVRWVAQRERRRQWAG